MTKRIAGNHGQWAANLFAAAQLAVRGYRVAPVADAESPLAAESPSGATFTVAVHGILREHSAWIVRRTHVHGPALYVAVLAIPSPGHPRYFVLSADEVAAALETAASPPRGSLGEYRIRDILDHEDRWEKLPR